MWRSNGRVTTPSVVPGAPPKPPKKTLARYNNIGLESRIALFHHFAPECGDIVYRAKRRGIEQIVIARPRRAAVRPIETDLLARWPAKKFHYRDAERAGFDVDQREFHAGNGFGRNASGTLARAA